MARCSTPLETYCWEICLRAISSNNSHTFSDCKGDKFLIAMMHMQEWSQMSKTGDALDPDGLRCIRINTVWLILPRVRMGQLDGVQMDSEHFHLVEHPV